MIRRLLAIAGLFCLPTLPGPARAEGRKPDPPKKDTGATLQEMKRDVNDALDQLEKGLKKAGRKMKKEASRALQKVDEGVHKIVDGP